ncbi:glycosyltransferase family 4 protein [Maioricimonas rarisocia]|nr:glycosyltransferase family 4 protein [Maioricimonas rarisocia]
MSSAALADAASSGLLFPEQFASAQSSAMLAGMSSGMLAGMSSATLAGMSSGMLVDDPAVSVRNAPPGERPLSIAHVGPCLFRGGAEQQLIDLARFLDPRTAVLEKCYVTDPQGIDPAVARDLPCEVVPAGIPEVTRAMQEHDVILCWGLPLDEWVDLSQPRRAVTVYIAHGDSFWTRELLSRSRQTVDHAVAVSERVRTTSHVDLPMSVILNGVDTARLATTRSRDQVRADFDFAPDDFVVGFVGRFSPEKRPELLIYALQYLPQNFKALFIGWGPMLPQLLRDANDLVPGRCAFRFADSYLGDYYEAFDAFALLSVQEGFALVFLEAMFCGTPVIATPVGAVPEVIEHRINGLVVDGAPQNVAGELARLSGNRVWARGLGETAREYARQHGHARRMAGDYENLFQQLVAARRGL